MAVDETSNVISDGNSPNISLQTGALPLVDVSSSELLEPKFSPITTPTNLFSSLDTPLPFDSLPENSSLEPHTTSPTLPFGILDMTNIKTIDVTNNNFPLNTENVISPELMTEKFECTKSIDNLDEPVFLEDTPISTSQTSKLTEPETSINGDSSSRATVSSKAAIAPSDLQLVSTNEVREVVVTGDELQLGSEYVIDELKKDETMGDEEEEGCARTDLPFYRYNENTTSSSVPSTRKREIIDDEFKQISSSKSEVKRRKVSEERPDSNIGLHNPLSTELLELNYKSNNGKSKGKEPLRSTTKHVFKTCKKNQSQIEQTTRKEFLQPVTTDECNQSDYEPAQSISTEMDHGPQPNSPKQIDPEPSFNEDGTNLNLNSQSDTIKGDKVIINITEEDRQMEHESQSFVAGEYQNLNHESATSEEPLEMEVESHTIASDNEYHPPVQHTKSDLAISDSQQIVLNDTWLSQDTQTLQNQAVLEESDLEEYACPDEEEMSVLTNMKDWTYEDKDFEVVSLGYYTDDVSNDNKVTSEMVGIYFEEVTYNDDIPSFYHHYVMPTYQNESQEGTNESQEEDPMSPHLRKSWQLVVASDIEDGMLLLLLCMDTIFSIEPDEIDRELLQRAIATGNDSLDSWSPTHSPKIVSASDNEEYLNIEEGEVYLKIDTQIIVHNFKSIRTVLKNQNVQRMK